MKNKLAGEKAEKVESGFITAFGNQIEWTTVYKV